MLRNKQPRARLGSWYRVRCKTRDGEIAPMSRITAVIASKLRMKVGSKLELKVKP